MNFKSDSQRRAMWANLSSLTQLGCANLSPKVMSSMTNVRSGAASHICDSNSFSIKADNVSRGKRFEQKIHARLNRSDSVVTMRSTGSRGLWDMVAITPNKVRLIQAKTHGYLTPDDREEMLVQLQHMPDNIQAEVEYYVSPKVTKNITVKKAGERDWDKVEERLDQFGKVRGYRKREVKESDIEDGVKDEI